MFLLVLCLLEWPELCRLMIRFERQVSTDSLANLPRMQIKSAIYSPKRHFSLPTRSALVHLFLFALNMLYFDEKCNKNEKVKTNDKNRTRKHSPRYRQDS